MTDTKKQRKKPSAAADQDGGNPVKEESGHDEKTAPAAGQSSGKEDGAQEGPQESNKIILDSVNRLNEYVDLSPQEFRAFMKDHPEALSRITNTLTNSIEPVLQAIQELRATSSTADTARRIQELQDEAADIVQAVIRTYFSIPEWASSEAVKAFYKELDDLKPYLNAEMEKLPEYKGQTFEEVLYQLPESAVYVFIEEDKGEEGTDEYEDDFEDDFEDEPEEMSPETSELFRKIDDLLMIRRAAREAKKAADKTPRTVAQRAKDIEYPLDKPNSIIWNLLEKDTAGQVSINLAKKGTSPALPAYYAINFDNLDDALKITKRLTPFDKRVYIAISALFNAGNTVISLTQIYYAMGYTGRPGAVDFTKINDAITKMTTARIFFDNQVEAKNYKYSRFRYDGSLLPLERGTGIINGQTAEAAIHIFREPPLISFAKQRRQVTTVDIKLLQSPVSKTNENLLIDDYLIDRISKSKKGKRHGEARILLSTLYTHAGIPTKPKTNTEKSIKQRAPKKIQKYLTHYQKEGFIKSFSMDADGITVYW